LRKLAFNGAASTVITGDSVTANVLRGTRCKVFQARKPLDLLKDDLASHAVTIGNLLNLWDAGDITGAYFLLPFVCLSLAARDPHLSVETRLGLLETAFYVFFQLNQYFPKCETGQGRAEKAMAGCAPRTLWAKNMCRRACNLCLEIEYAILMVLGRSDGEIQLAVQRIGSHDCECHFGTTRRTSFFTA
jgi:hypothetical protein